MCFINIFISNLRQKQQRYSRSQHVLHSLRKTLKHMTSSGRWVFRCAALWKRMCVKKQKQNKDSMWHVLCRICCLMRHMAGPAGVLISLLWWVASSSVCFLLFLGFIGRLPHFPSSACLFLPFSRYCYQEIPLVLCSHTHTKMQSLTEAIKGINRNSSNSRTMTVLQALNITASLHMAHHTL